MSNVIQLCRDGNKNAIYLSNGMVIDMSKYDNTGAIQQIAELKQTDRTNVYAIVGITSKAVIGYFDASTKNPTYLSNSSGNQGIIVSNNNGLNVGGTSTGFGDVATGAVTLDSIIGTNNSNTSTHTSSTTHTADVSKNNTIVPEEVLEFIDGYKFLPIPTDYTVVVTEKISGTAAKWKIKIKQNEKDDNMSHGKNPHDEVYTSLSTTAKNTLIEITELPDNSVLLFGSSSYAVAYMLSDNSSTDVTIITGEQQYGYYDGIDLVADVKLFNKNPDITFNEAGTVAIENRLIAIAKQSSSLHTWLRVAGNTLTKVEKAALRPYLVELLIDYLTTIENQLTFTTDSNPFDLDSDYLLNLINDNVDDITLRNKYLDGFDKIYSRLTNVNNLKNYDVLVYDLPHSDKHRLLRVGGISESIPLVVSKSAELDTELDRLINSSDDSIFKITDNTPNTLSLVKSIFNNTVKTNSSELFELSKYTTVGVDMFLLLLDSNILKVIRTDDSLLIRKLI